MFPLTTARATSHALPCVQSGIGAPGAATHAPGLVRSVLCSTCRTDIIAQFNHCWNCGTQPYRGPLTPSDPAALTVRTDTDILNARRVTLRAMMAGRPGPWH